MGTIWSFYPVCPAVFRVKVQNVVCCLNIEMSQSYRTIKLVLLGKLCASLTGRSVSALSCLSVSVLWLFCPAKSLSAHTLSYIIHAAWPHFFNRGTLFQNPNMARSLPFNPLLKFPKQGAHPHFQAFLFSDLQPFSKNLLCSFISWVPLHTGITEPQVPHLISCCVSSSHPYSFIPTLNSFSSKYTSTSGSRALAGYSAFHTWPRGQVCSLHSQLGLAHLQCSSVPACSDPFPHRPLQTLPSCAS